MKMLTAKDELI